MFSRFLSDRLTSLPLYLSFGVLKCFAAYTVYCCIYIYITILYDYLYQHFRVCYPVDCKTRVFVLYSDFEIGLLANLLIRNVSDSSIIYKNSSFKSSELSLMSLALVPSKVQRYFTYLNIIYPPKI